MFTKAAMTKASENVYNEEINEWSFPTIESISEEELQENAPEILDEKQIEHERQLEAIKAKENEIALLKEQYNEKIQLLNQILNKLENISPLIDQELLDLLQEILKKVVKKIIHKEIKSDPKILNKIVEELSLLLQNNTSLLTIDLSETDYKRFKQDDKNTSMVIKEDATLSEGDIVLKSHSAEIHSILDDRIEKILGMKK